MYVVRRNLPSMDQGEGIVSGGHDADKIKEYYTRPEIAAEYGRQQYITPCERLLFDTYIRPGMAILDIGVGGGRTSEFLAENASRYVGVDYAPEMIEICRNKYPQWEYFVCLATDLSMFQCGSFDAVVMAFNVLDDVLCDENRWQCLRECRRVLRDRGVLIFSSHNPRAIVVRPDWERGSDGVLVNRVSTIFSAIRFSIQRARCYVPKAPFWRGEGHMLDTLKLMTHFWVPAKVIRELTRAGFQLHAMKGDDYPSRSHMLITEWYYYVFSKAG